MSLPRCRTRIGARLGSRAMVRALIIRACVLGESFDYTLELPRIVPGCLLPAVSALLQICFPLATVSCATDTDRDGAIK